VTRVAAVQSGVADLDVAANLATLRERCGALPDDVEVALFPEHFLTGYVADGRLREAAIPADGPELTAVRDVAARHGLALLVGFVEREGATLYNALAYVTAESVVVYRKRHLWGSERDRLTAGEDRVVVETPAGRTGLLTCYDLNFVGESAAFTEERVDALFVAGAWPAAHGDNWRLLARARALDGVRWVVAVGRTGDRTVGDGTVAYNGRSLVVNPNGSVAHALDRRPRDLVATLDPAVLRGDRRAVGIFRDADRSSLDR
jgi:predicted amidohydrolase